MRLRRCFLSALAALMLSLSVASARAQLTQDILTTTGALSAEQNAKIESTVKGWVAQLASGSDGDVVDARNKLLDQFDKSNSQIFRVAYSGVVARELLNMKSDRPIVRLNAMIITARLIDKAALELVRRGLVDESPAVRYWAAKAVAPLAVAQGQNNTPLLDSTEQQAILDELGQAAGKEPASDVVEPILTSMAALTLPEAQTRVLEALNARVKKTPMHASADREGLLRVFQKVAQQTTGAPPTNLLKLLAKVCYREMVAAASVIDSGKASPEMVGEYWQLIDIADTALRHAVKVLDPAAVQPKPLPKTTRKIGDVLLTNDDWTGLLQTKTIGLTAAELQVK